MRQPQYFLKLSRSRRLGRRTMLAVGAAYIGVQPWVKNYNPVNGVYGVGAETWAKAWTEKG